MKKIKLYLFICIGLLFNQNNSTAQVTNNTHVGFVGEWCGWDAPTAFDFNIEHRNNRNINFHTFNTQRMTILGTATYNIGFVGMGLTGPRLNLEVDRNIGLIPSVFDHSYRIDSVPMLRSWVVGSPGVYSNIFVGENAGLNNLNTGIDNTFVGSSSGINNTTGRASVFVGSGAGDDNTTGIQNIFIGTSSGDFNTSGNFNVWEKYF